MQNAAAAAEKAAVARPVSELAAAAARFAAPPRLQFAQPVDPEVSAPPKGAVLWAAVLWAVLGRLLQHSRRLLGTAH